jgi:catechol 2,3-dioxygenase-like lactoylglutathione lyase family enzyme
MSVTPCPRVITHVGLTVTDIRHAISWYGATFGFRLILGPVEIRADGTRGGEIAADVFGPGFRHGWIAHLASANGMAIELFEFEEPATERRQANFEYWKTGFSHICVADPDIAALARAISESGGKIRTTRIWRMYDDGPYETCYCEDPFGNVIELYSHPHEQVYSNRW